MAEPSPPPAPDKLRALIVDDEAPARARLRRMLEELGEVAVVGEASTRRSKRSNTVRRSTRTSCCSTCACRAWTASRRRATWPRWMNRRPSFSRPPTTSTRCRRSRRRRSATSSNRCDAKSWRARSGMPRASPRPQLIRLADQSQLGRRRAQICARRGDQLKLVPVSDILYFAADQKYVTMRHRGGSELIDESLRALADEFAGDFVRIHRNSLVALAARACSRAHTRRKLHRAVCRLRRDIADQPPPPGRSPAPDPDGAVSMEREQQDIGESTATLPAPVVAAASSPRHSLRGSACCCCWPHSCT